MKNIDYYLTENIPNYKLVYHSYNQYEKKYDNSTIISKYSNTNLSTQKNNNKNIKYFNSSEENSNFKSINKSIKKINSSINSKNNFYNYLSKTEIPNSQRTIYYNNSNERNKNTLYNNYKNNIIRTDIYKKDCSININQYNYNNRTFKPNNSASGLISATPKNKKIKKADSYYKIVEDKNNNKNKQIKLDIKIPTQMKSIDNSSKKNNHSFFEVKSLTKDKKNIIIPKKKLNIKIDNNNGNNKDNIYYKNNLTEINNNRIVKEVKINNNINLIINSNSVKYIKNILNNSSNDKNNNLNKITNINEFSIKKYNNNINFKKINKIAEIPRSSRKNNIPYDNKRYKINTRIIKYKLNQINSNFFSYFPSLQQEKFKKIKKMKNSNENKLLLKNLDCKTYEEDFPLKIKYSRIYYKNKNLKPQRAFKFTLFKIIKPEIERYFIVNFFYSENIRNYNNDKNKSEIYFQ